MLLSMLLGGSAPAQPTVLRELPEAAIVLVRCGRAAGTAFHIGGGRYITAAHVASFGECSIGGAPAPKVAQVNELDMAELQGPTANPALTIDCGGFKVNRHYLGIGYAGGVLRMELPLIYSAFGRHPDGGNGIFVGAQTEPGMSGGPLINESLRVSGIVLQRWPSRARSLSETYLCGANHA